MPFQAHPQQQQQAYENNNHHHDQQHQHTMALNPARRAPLGPKDPNVHVRQQQLAESAIPEYPSLGKQSGSVSTSSRAVLSQAGASKRTASHSPPVSFKTPKKRAVPREGTHSRNVVDANHHDDEYDEESPPHKRSRSSKGDSSGHHGSGSVSGIISKELGKLHVVEETAAMTPRSLTGTRPQLQSASSRTRIVAPQTNARQAIPPSQAQTPTTTTTRIDKHSRMSVAERAEKDEDKRQQHQEWRRKFSNGFPKFVFYLDGFDEKSKNQIEHFILGCGGKIDAFFSKNCTHVVTSRKTVPAAPTPIKQAASAVSVAPQPTPSSKGPSSILPSVIRKTKRFSPSKKNFLRRNKDTPLHSDRNPFEDSTSAPPATSAAAGNDVVSKATEYNMRVWTSAKFWHTMGLLLGRELNDDAVRSKQNLAEMLRHEKIHGTSERDVNAPRDDMHYFDKRAIYIFVGDATQEHRPVMNYQFDPKDIDAEIPPWPVLYGNEEGRCPFMRVDEEKRQRRQQRRAAMAAEEAANAKRALMEQQHQQQLEIHREKSFRRTFSHNHAGIVEPVAPELVCPTPKEDFHREASPYQLASGNSVSLASNVTSMANTGSQAMLVGGAAGLAPQDKRVTQLSRRMVSPAPTQQQQQQQQQQTHALQEEEHRRQLARQKEEQSLLQYQLYYQQQQEQQAQRSKQVVEQQQRINQQCPATPRQAKARSTVPAPATNHTPAPAASARTRHLSGADAHAARVRDSLGMSNNHVDASERSLMRSASVETGLLLQQEQLRQETIATKKRSEQQQRHDEQAVQEAQAEQQEPAKKARQQEKKPFCENCRETFDDFHKHINSEKHRKFAQTDENFVAVDELIARISRPMAPWVALPEYAHFLRSPSDEEEEDEEAEEEEDGYDASIASYYEGYDEDDSLYDAEAVEDADEDCMSNESGARTTGEATSAASDCYIDYDGLQEDAFVVFDGDEIVLASPRFPGEQSYETNTSYEEDEEHTTPHTSPEARPQSRNKHSPTRMRLDQEGSSRQGSVA